MNEEQKKQKEAADKKAAEDAAAAERQKAIDEATGPLKKQLEEAQIELKKLQDKDFNFGKVVKSEKEKEILLDEATKKIKDLETRIGEIAAAPAVQAKNDLLKSLAGDDKVLRDKLEFQFNRLGQNAKTPQEVESAMREAYLLATGAPVKTVDALRKVQGSGGSNNRVAPVNSQGQIDSQVKEWAGEFNKHLPKGLQISDEDLKNPKYALKPGQSSESK